MPRPCMVSRVVRQVVSDPDSHRDLMGVVSGQPQRLMS
jgi:hypothetical protein